jgi:hypothetical protein
VIGGFGRGGKKLSKRPIRMDQHLGIAILSPVELLVRGRRLVDADLVRDDEGGGGAAGDDHWDL